MVALLIIERGINIGTRIQLKDFPVLIGRDPSNTICIDDQEASRFHLKIKKRGNLYILEDLESKNGTYLNGDQVLNSVIKSEDKILIGSTELRFVASTPKIHVVTNEYFEFDKNLGNELGINGPISLTNQDLINHTFTPKRLDPVNIFDSKISDSKSSKKIFDIHSNILVIDDLEEAAKTLLKSINQLSAGVSRGAIFTWNEQKRQLFPISSSKFENTQESFLLSQRSIHDCISRKKGVILTPDTPNVTQSTSRTRIIMPMIQHSEVLCVVHLESDSNLFQFTEYDIKMIQSLLNRVAPNFDSLLLRREQDKWMLGMVETMIATIEAKDTYTVGHSERVCEYSMAIANELKLNREVKRLLMISSLCHDIGKIGIPDSILKKAARLSPDEYDEMKLHPTIGADIISNLPNAHRFISGVKYHHEKWDGTGYPEGLAGEEIPFFGRIIAVADVFDAMISGRSYSGFINESEAVEKLASEEDIFDPEIVKALVKSYENGLLTKKTSTQSQDPEEELNKNNIIK